MSLWPLKVLTEPHSPLVCTCGQLTTFKSKTRVLAARRLGWSEEVGPQASQRRVSSKAALNQGSLWSGKIQVIVSIGDEFQMAPSSQESPSISLR